MPVLSFCWQIYFQTIIKDDMNIGEEDATEGEIQIERITVRMIEARSKNLVPVFDHQQIPKLQMSRYISFKV